MNVGPMARPVPHNKPKAIAVINSKGGCGKTTISSNLASYYASQNFATALMDCDPQGSSTYWHSQRPSTAPPIHIITAHQQHTRVTRSFLFHAPPGTERMIIDPPAGISGFALQDLVRRTDVIVIPVVPSPIDIHATAHFIRDLYLEGKLKQRGTRLAVIANRVKQYSTAYEPLQRFLESLEIPFLTQLWDSRYYLRASETGLGIHEMDKRLVKRDQRQWVPLLEWLERE